MLSMVKSRGAAAWLTRLLWGAGDAGLNLSPRETSAATAYRVAALFQATAHTIRAAPKRYEEITDVKTAVEKLNPTLAKIEVEVPSQNSSPTWTAPRTTQARSAFPASQG